MRIYKLLLIFLVVLFAGCGTESTSTTSGGSSGGSGGGSTTVPDVAAIQLSASTSTIGTGGTTTITIRLYTASGQLVTDSKTVTFSLSNPILASITPTATTSSGVISQTLTAKSFEGTVTLKASVDSKSADQTIQISNQTAAATVNLAANPASVTVGGTSVISATVLDSNGDPMANGTTVNFSVNDSSLGSIVPSAAISGGAGVAQATFSAGITTAGTTTITATSGSALGTTTIPVSAAAAGSIEFLSAAPQIIVIQGAGGQETSDVEFLVKDSSGNPVAGSQTVHLTLSGPNGGEYIGPDPGVSTLDVGTVSGIAKTILHSGTIPGTATITAAVDGTSLSTSSGVIAIGGGVPSAGHFSLSTTALNLEGLNYDNIKATITTLIADRYGNYNVLAGTAVSFYSECGAIDRAINLDNTGAGTVTFRTQEPGPQTVPLDDTADGDNLAPAYQNLLGVTMTDDYHPRNGLCTVVAVVDGEEEFTDANANGRYDLGESFEDTYDDIHLDKDDDPENIPPGSVTPGYPFDPTFEDLIVDRNGNGDFDGMNGVWDGNKRISKQIKLLDSGLPTISIGADSNAINQGDLVTIGDGESKTIYFSVHDENFNPPIGGTTVKVTADVGSLSGQTDYTFLDTSVPGAPIFAITIIDSKPGDSDPPAIGVLKFTWNWKGNNYTFSTPLSVD